jgi:hypothetical protein
MSLEHDDDSTWDPGDVKYNNCTNSSFEDDNFVIVGNNDKNDHESIKSAGSTKQANTKPQFDHRDVAMLKLTKGLLYPGDLVSYRLRHP